MLNFWWSQNWYKVQTECTAYSPYSCCIGVQKCCKMSIPSRSPMGLWDNPWDVHLSSVSLCSSHPTISWGIPQDVHLTLLWMHVYPLSIPSHTLDSTHSEIQSPTMGLTDNWLVNISAAILKQSFKNTSALILIFLIQEVLRQRNV